MGEPIPKGKGQFWEESGAPLLSNGTLCRDAFWKEDWNGPNEPRIRWGPDPPKGRDDFWEFFALFKSMVILAVQQQLNARLRSRDISMERTRRPKPTDVLC